MMRLQSLDTWIGDGLTTETAHRPACIDIFSLTNITDQPTGQPANNLIPAPNMLVVEIICADATYDAIITHHDYGIGAVLWSKLV